jgi:Bacteriocin-protection, YdeI or OmpD-Associated
VANRIGEAENDHSGLSAERRIEVGQAFLHVSEKEHSHNTSIKRILYASVLQRCLVNDANGILIKPTENTQAARQIRFTNVREIVEMETILKAYIYEAIEAEKAGLKVKFKEITEFKIPEELQNKLDEIPALKTAFAALTPGRQRAYILYFSAPKQSKTRESRVEKCMQQILNLHLSSSSIFVDGVQAYGQEQQSTSPDILIVGRNMELVKNILQQYQDSCA